MNESRTGDAPEPTPPLTRRLLLRAGAALGLTATGVALTGTAAARPDAAPRGTSPVDVPDPVGAFGRAPTAAVRRRQRDRGAISTQSTGDAAAGTRAGPEPTSAAGVRLQPSTVEIDATPLSRRTSGTPWTIEGR